MQVFMKRWSWVAAVAGLAMYAGNAQALYVEQYEMNSTPELPAGTLNGNVMSATGAGGSANGTGTNGPSGFVYSGGIGTFLDDANSSGNQGMRLNGAGVLLGATGYTADIRIRWLQGTAGNGGQKSMGFAGNTGAGRGLRVDSNNLYYVSSGIAATGSGIDMTTGFKELRIVVQTDGSQSVYLLGSNTAILTVTAPGATGVNVAIDTGPGFFLGSMGGSSTTLSNYELDWVRLAQGTDVLADHVPEPATLALLALGGIPMMIRRRRAA